MELDWKDIGEEAHRAAEALDLAQQRPGRPAWINEQVTKGNLNQHVPGPWSSVERENPVSRKKTRVTIRLDEDVAAWFREQGRGHQTRMNAVLRAYMFCNEGNLL
ncbi:MAG: BrnA antitoxin family protein [Pseudomonadota bacterium]